MALRLFNTLSRGLEEFRPLDGRHVGVYACGPTVYRPPHIGNFRTFVFNDILHRYLEWKGWTVTFVMNLTDVEDKIIAGAVEAGVAIDTITAPVTDAFFADLDCLGIRPADQYPRATAHIGDMVTLVERLVAAGHAYVREGSVYFDINSFPQYGRLSRIDFAGMRSGAGLAEREGGIDADEYDKQDARDFALWKAARDEDRKAGAAWSTPWGEGRPGWHIECSAMSMAALGETLDIHTGGEDLIFPHHEDEIAQSEGATGKPFSRFWLHVTHLKVNGQKMSKSLRNDYRINDLLERGFSPAAIRFQLLQAHYRKELNFSFDGLQDAKTALQRLTNFRDRLDSTPVREDAAESPLPDLATAAIAAFEAAMDDDLNTPNALAVVFPFVNEVNAALDAARTVRPADLDAARNAIDRMDDVLGVISLARRDAATADTALVEWVEDRLEQRQAARRRRDFAAADAIRDELVGAGIAIEDTPGGTRWRRA
jgi:cysteinyl-tRNA synthetase